LAKEKKLGMKSPRNLEGFLGFSCCPYATINAMFPFRKKKDLTFTRKKAPAKRLTPLQFQLVVGVVIGIIIALLITAIWYVTRVQAFQIEHVVVVGGQTIPHAVIKEKAETALEGSYLSLIPKRFLPLYPKDEIIQSIKMLNRVNNIAVERTEDQTLTIIFDEYIPYALWCEEEELEGQCLFIDQTGYAFAPAPSLEGSAFVRYQEDGLIPEVKVVAFEKKFIDETEEFAELLQEYLSLYVTHVTKLGNYDMEFKIAGGGVIKLSQSIPVEESFENLETILTSEEFMHIEPGLFKYIDLRFGEKIFVNESLGSVATTTASTTELE